ncbi:phenylpyruvate tautomerase PptA (4-oxalocrotonate tautomerase family) [Acidovorax sp. 69]|uniref:tautomerase family protein n=1 Tax=Acidovorax sp. 69 TaxID=2035202 RepID=UPI000C247157|nr:tautomerase enzyme [Acidovorax sp. 69]PJI96116.1 phenylpyruvate tautomerase PptA (4-oxalocrotonate tautomerase family) [Acidovorax sp. 69]
MTIITIATPKGRLSVEQRRQLAQTLTDAVLIPEVGQLAVAARVGFQVHFVERAPSEVAIAGVLLSDQHPMPDLATIDICVMEGDWSPLVRKQVIENTLSAMTSACGLNAPSPTWWVNFRVIDEGSWGSRGRVTSILDLLASGVFTTTKAEAIRQSLVRKM